MNYFREEIFIVFSLKFKENYLNQPYGDIWHKINLLAYKKHPYQWPTIGKTLEHIENAKLEDVKSFFFQHYRPNNAIMVVAGKIKAEQVKILAEKWFGDIPSGIIAGRNLPVEPRQNEERKISVQAKVPLDAIYKIYHIGKRIDQNFYIADVITNILSLGHSSRFYQQLVKEKKYFSEIDAFVSASLDPGLLIIQGKLVKGISMEQAESAINEELNNIQSKLIGERELQKIKNKIETQLEFEETNLFTKAFHLAFFELLGDAEMINQESEKYLNISGVDIKNYAQEIFRKDNCSTIYYYAQS